MEVIVPERLKAPSVSSRKSLVKVKKPKPSIKGTKSAAKAGKTDEKDDGNVKSLTSELNFIKDTLLQMVTNNKVNAEKVKQRKEAFAKKNKAAVSLKAKSGQNVSLKAKSGQNGDAEGGEKEEKPEVSPKVSREEVAKSDQDGDQNSAERMRRRAKKSSKDPTWNNPEALKKMSATQLFQIITYKDKKCAEWADMYKSCKYEKGLLELRVEDLNAIQWDLQRRLNETSRDFSAFLEGKELDPSSPCGQKPLSVEDKANPLTKKYRNLLVRNSLLSRRLKETKAEHEAAMAEKTAAIAKLEEGQQFLVLNQRQLTQQNHKLKRSLQEKNMLIEQIKEQAPITYTLKNDKELVMLKKYCRRKNKQLIKMESSAESLHNTSTVSTSGVSGLSGVSGVSVKEKSSSKTNPGSKSNAKKNKKAPKPSPMQRSGSSLVRMSPSELNQEVHRMGGDYNANMDAVALSNKLGDLIHVLHTSLDHNLLKDEEVANALEPNFLAKYCLAAKGMELNELNNFIGAFKGVLVDELLVNCKELVGCLESEDKIENIAEQKTEEKKQPPCLDIVVEPVVEL